MKNSDSFLVDNSAPVGQQASKTASDVAVDQRHGDAGGTPSFIFRHFLHRDAKISKLVTREDGQHIHKTLGILSVISFFYRYGYVYNTTGTLGFDGPAASSRHTLFLDWATMLVHTALAFSSIIFRVPKRRINNKPMVIYEEYRQHAMVFTLRCLLVFAAVYALPAGSPAWVPPLAVMLCHLMADRITSIHGTQGNTAVRATQRHMKISTFYRYVGKLYSLYQFLAIGSHILPNARLADLGYNAIIAIQSSAFMMTLYRKRIIRGRTHMVVYAACLVLSGFHIVRLIGLHSCVLVTAAFLTRINLPRKWSNKYIIWFGFLMAANGPWLLEQARQPAVLALDLKGLTGSELSGAGKGTLLGALAYAAFVGERALMGDKPKKA